MSYTFSTSVVDSVPLAKTTLHYSTDGGPYREAEMEKKTMRFNAGEIPPQPFWSNVSYFVQAVDSAYQTLREPEDAPISTFDFTVMDVPDLEQYECGPCGLGLSVASADYDQDGFVDLFLATRDGPVLLRNMGDLSFQNVTADAGLGAVSDVNGGSWGDYDNDGFPDLFVASYEPGVSHTLMRNTGSGLFEDVTISAGLADTVETATGIWGDVDGDGFLDLFTVQKGADRLYVNRKDGTFEESAEEWGIEEETDDRTAAFLDIDGDRDLDLLITGGGGNALYRNVEGEYFEDIFPSSGLGTEFWKSVAPADYDNDGDPDLLFSGSPLALYENSGGSFTDVTEQLRLGGLAAHHASWVDLNLDGLLDVVTTIPTVHIRKPGGEFIDLTDISGISGGVGNRLFPLPLDIDSDGRPDLVINDLWRHAGYNGTYFKHWLSVTLEGTASNRSAVGAKVSLYAGDIRTTRWVGGCGGRAQEPPALLFGSETAQTVDSLVIGWPSGITQRIANFRADVRLTVTEDEVVDLDGEKEAGPALPRAFTLRQNYPNPFNPQTTIVFDVPEGEDAVYVRLSIYDVRGRLVKTLVDTDTPPGNHRVVWDGTDATGTPVGSGIYLSSLEADGFSSKRKLVLVR